MNIYHQFDIIIYCRIFFFFISAKYIYSVDGFKGMYIGLSPKILAICIEHYSSLAISDYIKIDKNHNLIKENSNLEV